jgi:predicted ATPase with chaperone activity
VQQHLSVPAYHRIQKLICTIADLAESEDIRSARLARAVQCRLKMISLALLAYIIGLLLDEAVRDVS